MNHSANIFEMVKTNSDKNSSNEQQLIEGISGRFDHELECYAFYKQDKNNIVESIVYVTQRFFEAHNDIQALEKTVLNYLKQKKGMQATFKTSGIDELPLVKLNEEK